MCRMQLSEELRCALESSVGTAFVHGILWGFKVGKGSVKRQPRGCCKGHGVIDIA